MTVSTPSSWLTSSGCPEMLSMSRQARSSVLSTATDPETARTRSAVTWSKSSAVGVSTVQCDMVWSSPAVHTNDISRCRKVKMYRDSAGGYWR